MNLPKFHSRAHLGPHYPCEAKVAETGSGTGKGWPWGERWTQAAVGGALNAAGRLGSHGELEELGP